MTAKDGRRGVDVLATAHRPLTPTEQRAAAVKAARMVLRAMPKAPRSVQRAALADVLTRLGLHEVPAAAEEAS